MFDRILPSLDHFKFFISNFCSDQSLRLSRELCPFSFAQLPAFQRHSEFSLMSVFSSPRNSFHSEKEFFQPFFLRYFINKIPNEQFESAHIHFTVVQGGKQRILEITFDCDAFFVCNFHLRRNFIAFFRSFVSVKPPPRSTRSYKLEFS